MSMSFGSVVSSWESGPSPEPDLAGLDATWASNLWRTPCQHLLFSPSSSGMNAWGWGRTALHQLGICFLIRQIHGITPQLLPKGQNGHFFQVPRKSFPLPLAWYVSLFSTGYQEARSYTASSAGVTVSSLYPTTVISSNMQCCLEAWMVSIVLN